MRGLCQSLCWFRSGFPMLQLHIRPKNKWEGSYSKSVSAVQFKSLSHSLSPSRKRSLRRQGWGFVCEKVWLAEKRPFSCQCPFSCLFQNKKKMTPLFFKNYKLGFRRWKVLSKFSLSQNKIIFNDIEFNSLCPSVSNFNNQEVNLTNVTDTINMHAACLMCQGQSLKVVAIGWLFPARNVARIRLS